MEVLTNEEGVIEFAASSLVIMKTLPTLCINFCFKIYQLHRGDNGSVNRVGQSAFLCKRKHCNTIGPRHKARLAAPGEGLMRLSFLVADGLYFGQGPFNHNLLLQ